MEAAVHSKPLAMCSAFWPQKTICRNCGFFYTAGQVMFNVFTPSFLYLFG